MGTNAQNSLKYDDRLRAIIVFKITEFTRLLSQYRIRDCATNFSIYLY